jgi:formylmethanofuran dehydrogenase subunit C
VIRLTLRVPSAIPLDVDGLTPARVAGLSVAAVERLPVRHGNRTEPLAEFFDVSPRVTVAPGPPDIQFAGDTRNVHGIGAGMDGGFVYVENDAGRHAGARMTAGTLVVDSSAGDWLGAEMRGGSIEVRHSAGGQVGAAYRGSRQGMRGGTIRVRGSAGDEVGLLMRRGVILVERGCGEFAGASMITGSLFLPGGCGRRVGAGMKRGTIVVGGEPELPPGFAFACEYRPTFLSLYGRPAGTVKCYRGDLVTGGRGEVLVTG